ncbi:hypothetical protein CYLTODRAFT_162470 [Cylindrobasidium torrendii FP15055 ss-10]|uniref:DUF6535 domain-containing protein n=1 Tax=Cylindrobasidium torrendii FP15055 ss-10 TaxID=1314674 RepID=A0A0D7AY07_9AGAR|nr:hypothetical protein CYLTODRAFT_162470 [Cylindrobasidium torrendii FP15055 ss-10]
MAHVQRRGSGLRHGDSREAADSLDILLVFAGLFSAVLTTFVAQTSQSLSTDNAAVTVSLLGELVALQRAALTGASLSDIASANLSPAIERTSIWVNALWFTSLALSLSSALLAVLSKQWLRQYVSFIAGSARERALIRQFRYDGMEKWAVRTIVGLLPMILHLALGLFLAGLVVFLAPLQRGIAISVGTISGALFIAYSASIIIAVVHVQSPYRTTFSDILSTSFCWIFATVYPIFQPRLGLPKASVESTARAAEKNLAVCLEEHAGATQACRALLWLHNTTGSVSAKTLIKNSLGAFPSGFQCGSQLSIHRNGRRFLLLLGLRHGRLLKPSLSLTRPRKRRRVRGRREGPENDLGVELGSLSARSYAAAAACYQRRSR